MNRMNDLEKLHQACRGAVRLRTLGILFGIAALILFVWLMLTLRAAQGMVETFSDDTAVAALEILLRRQLVLTLLLFAAVIALILLATFLIIQPIRRNLDQILARKTLTVRGAYEIRCIAASYNLMVRENEKHDRAMRYKVEHDHLTGLLNRGSFDMLSKKLSKSPIALLVVDVDKFKDVNDTYGHDMGDRVLKRVGWLLGHAFRAGDHPFRIGGDEFAVIMCEMTPMLKDVVLEKIEFVKNGLKETEDELPRVTLSIGVAFRSQCGAGDDLFKLADAALYRVKSQGRDGCAFYEPEIDGKHR